MTVIRSGALRGLRTLVRELGGDADILAAEIGLPAGALDTEEMLLPTDAVDALLRRIAAEFECPDLGLRLADRQDLEALGAIGLVLRSCSTMAEVLACSMRYVPVQSPSMALALGDDPYGVPGVVALRNVGATRGPHNPGIDAGMATIHRSIIELTGGRYGLRSVELPYRPAAPLSRYEEFFGAPVHIERPDALLRVPATLLNAPVIAPVKPDRRHIIEAFLEERLPAQRTAPLTPIVRVTIQQMLGSGRLSMSAVASAIGIHPRTLQRRLREEHTSFTGVLDDARRHVAHRYLTTTDLSFTRIAAEVGLSEQSALARCARRWWNRTPAEVRREGS